MKKVTLMFARLVCAVALLAFAPAGARAQAAFEPGAVAVEPGAEEAAARQELKVMTWNIHGGEGCRLAPRAYLDKVETEIRRHRRLDLIALQEVHRGQANTLATRLGFYSHFVEMRRCGSNERDFGLAILSRHYFGVNGKEATLPAGACRDVIRKVAAVTVRVHGKLVHFYATHLTACGGAEGQAAQIARLRAFIRRDLERPGRRGPFRAVLVGDFNVKPFDAPYFDLTGEFRDVWREAPRPTLANLEGLTYETTNLWARIDYVFLRQDSGLRPRELRVTDPQTIFRTFGTRKKSGVPDHLPVVARFTFE